MTLSASTFAWRTACWALGPRSAFGSSLRETSGTAAQSPAEKTPATPRTVRSAWQGSRPISSRGRSVSASIGCARTPPVHHRLQPGVEAHVDLALGEALDGVEREPDRHLGHDPGGRLDEHPAHVVRLDAVVVAGGVAGHVLQLGDRLHAGIAAADEHERERTAATLLIARGHG